MGYLFKRSATPRVKACHGLTPQPARPEATRKSGKRAVETGRGRLGITAACLTIGFAIISMRLIVLMSFSPEDVREPAVVDMPIEKTASRFARADIVDRNGLLLATNLPVTDLYADTRGVPKAEIDRAITALPTLFPDLKPEVLVNQLQDGRAYIPLRRNLTPVDQQRVNDLGIPGLNFERTDRRVYPAGRLVAHVVGATDVDNRGIAGLEKAFDPMLRASEEPIALSIDLRIQHIVHRVLSETITHFNAIGGVAVVMDARTAELLAMVSLPDYEPEQIGRAAEIQRFNRATLGVYELGSVFKVINTAMALDAGVPLDATFDATAPIRIGRHSISDYKGKNRPLSIPEIMMYSSNIGSAKMALRVGGSHQQTFLRNMGLLDPIRFELPETGRPLVPQPWREVSTMTVAFGHGLSVTPLHLTTAVSAIVNGGIMVPPTLLRVDPAAGPREGTRVISAETSQKMRALLRLVVESGSGKNANVPGYYVGGKTGTADKLIGRGYARNSVLASFVAAFPMTDPRYTVLVVLDDPKPVQGTYGYRTAGWNATPAAGRIIAEISPILGVSPTYESPEGFFGESLIQTVGLKVQEREEPRHAQR